MWEVKTTSRPDQWNSSTIIKWGTRESQTKHKNVHITSQNIKAPKLTNEKQEDEIYPKNRATVEANFSLCRPPIKISTVQNEEQDVKNLQFKFHVDPTEKEWETAVPKLLLCVKTGNLISLLRSQFLSLQISNQHLHRPEWRTRW